MGGRPAQPPILTAPSQPSRSLPRCARGPGSCLRLPAPSPGSWRRRRRSPPSDRRRRSRRSIHAARRPSGSKLVHRPVFRPYAVEADCRPLRGVFYAQTDWLRLATTLAANASPCAQYSISVPPVVADKTRFRPDQAQRIRALGPNIHALAEIHFSAWQKWVASTGSSWYQAGVEARRRMAAAGIRRGGGRHVGDERGLVRRAPGRRQRPHEPSRAPARAVRRGRRGPADARRRVHRGNRPARSGRDLQGSYAGVAAGQRVLVRHERVRRRLVAGGLRRRQELRGTGCAAREPPRRARRVPPPSGPARRGGRRRLRHGERVLRERG